MTDDIVTRLQALASNYKTSEFAFMYADYETVCEASAEIERWRNIAKELHTWLLPDWEDWETAKAGVYAMEMYEKAVRGE